MAVKLGDLLLQEGIVTLAQLEEALKYQVIFGGKLGTNLIEMGVIEEEEIARVLGRKFGVPVADSEQLMSVPAEVIALVPREIAEKYRVVPLQLDGRRLTLAMTDPADLKTVDEIAFRTGFIIRPAVAADVRLVLALEKFYGVERERRYIHAAKRVEVRKKAPPAPPVGGGAQAPPAPPSPARAPSRPRREPASAIEKTSAAAAPPAAPAEPEEVVDLAGAELQEEEAAAGALPFLTADTIPERFVEARDRDDILDALAGYLGREFHRCALFLVRGEMALGWKCTANGEFLPHFDQLQIPLDEPSVLKTVAESRSYYLGPLPRTPFTSMMLQEIGGRVPTAALLVPLLMMGRVVGIIYVDAQGIDLGERLFDLQKLIAKAAMAFEILVLKNKILSM